MDHSLFVSLIKGWWWWWLESGHRRSKKEYWGESRSSELKQVECQEQLQMRGRPFRSQSRWWGQYHGELYHGWSQEQPWVSGFDWPHRIGTRCGPAPCCDLSSNGKPARYRHKFVRLYEDAMSLTGLSVTSEPLLCPNGYRPLGRADLRTWTKLHLFRFYSHGKVTIVMLF